MELYVFLPVYKPPAEPRVLEALVACNGDTLCAAMVAGLATGESIRSWRELPRGYVVDVDVQRLVSSRVYAVARRLLAAGVASSTLPVEDAARLAAPVVRLAASLYSGSPASVAEALGAVHEALWRAPRGSMTAHIGGYTVTLDRDSDSAAITVSLGTRPVLAAASARLAGASGCCEVSIAATDAALRELRVACRCPEAAARIAEMVSAALEAAAEALAGRVEDAKSTMARVFEGYVVEASGSAEKIAWLEPNPRYYAAVASSRSWRECVYPPGSSLPASSPWATLGIVNGVDGDTATMAVFLGPPHASPEEYSLYAAIYNVSVEGGRARVSILLGEGASLEDEVLVLRSPRATIVACGQRVEIEAGLGSLPLAFRALLGDPRAAEELGAELVAFRSGWFIVVARRRGAEWRATLVPLAELLAHLPYPSLEVLEEMEPREVVELLESIAERAPAELEEALRVLGAKPTHVTITAPTLAELLRRLGASRQEVRS